MVEMSDIEQILKKFENKDHKKTTEDYLLIRKEVDNVKLSSIISDIRGIYYLSKFLKDKPFDKATREDMRKWVNWLDAEGQSKESANLYKMKIKRFYKYITEPDKFQNGRIDQRDIRYPDSVRWITKDNGVGNELPLDNILNEKQIKKMLDACKDTREQVILCSFLDGGLRKSELINLKVKNIGFDKTLGVYFILPKKGKDMKTGMRKVQLFLIPSSSAYIKEYMNHHKYKHDPEAPFIYNTNPNQKYSHPGLQISNTGFNEIIDRIVKNSGFKQHIRVHDLRHNSATYCAMKGFNEFEMRERFGWSKTSKMPSKYVHLASKDIDNKIKKILGIKEETVEDSILQPIICMNCNHENPPTHVFCSKCSTKLNIKKEDLGVDATTTGIAMQKILEDPKKAREILKMLLQMATDKQIEQIKKEE